MNGVEMRRLIRIAVLTFVGVAILLSVWGWLLDDNQFSAAASGLQALFLVPALTLAVATLLSDSRDRRVDRVTTLHTELTSGELDEARRRLVKHLREHGPDNKPRVVSRHELDKDQTLSKYSNGQPSRPLDDTNRLLRYFERAEAMRLAGSLFEPLLVQLIGRHATWINLAIEPEANNTLRRSLSNFADWANEYAESNKHRFPYLADWGSSRTKDFGQIQ
jgi:hypothetical protein